MSDEREQLDNFITAVTVFRKAIQAFTAAVDKMDTTIAAEMQTRENVCQRYETMFRNMPSQSGHWSEWS